MSLPAVIWWHDDEDGDGYEDDGAIEVEVAGDEIYVHFMVRKRNIATATLDRFEAGVLVGSLTAAAQEAANA